MALNEFASWLDSTSLSTAMKDNFWAIPPLQSIHILSVCFVFAAALVVSLRTLNVIGPTWTNARWAQRLYPAHWWALLVLAITGALQVTAEPFRELLNPYFQGKMAALVVAVALSLFLMRGLSRGEERVGAGLRLVGVVVLLLWAGMIFAGRWIAYA